MPELPDLEVMREVLSARVLGREISGVRACRPEILKTVEPALSLLEGETFRRVSRTGKHLVFTCREDLHLVLHLMVAGRLVVTQSRTTVTKATSLLVSFVDGEDLRVIENGSVKRAKAHVVRDPEDVEWVARTGVEPLSDEFTVGYLTAQLTGLRRQAKKAITDPSLVAGIGTAYADEILFAARLSPIRYVSTLSGEEVARLHEAIQGVLRRAIDETRVRSKGVLVAEGVRDGMRVYRRAGEPCPVCGGKIAEIRFAETRTFYCPQCQSGGKTVADRRAWLAR